MRCRISSSTNRSFPLSSQDRFLAVLDAHFPEHSVSTTPFEDTQYLTTHPTTISRRRSMKLTSAIFATAVALGFAAAPSLAQDPVKAAPQAFKEILNNSEVRVLEYSSKPGQKEAMHSHPAVLLYVIQGGKLKSTAPDGTSKEIEYKTGDIQWREAVTHTGENVGTTEMKSLLIEVKHGKKK
jgi:quercetin dioxygenase-like cupin family protein